MGGALTILMGIGSAVSWCVTVYYLFMCWRVRRGLQASYPFRHYLIRWGLGVVAFLVFAGLQFAAFLPG